MISAFFSTDAVVECIDDLLHDRTRRRASATGNCTLPARESRSRASMIRARRSTAAWI